MKYHLYSYNGLSGLRKIEESHVVFPFIFQETLQSLQENPKICIDITTLVHYLRSNRGDRYPALFNLRAITEETMVIIDEEIANEAVSVFPLVFFDVIPYEATQKPAEQLPVPPRFLWNRSPIYTYEKSSELDLILEYAKEKSIPIATFSQATGSAKDEYEKLNKTASMAIVDLTSVSRAIESNKSIIYTVELLFNMLPNICVIAEASQIDNILTYFPLYFKGWSPIRTLLPDLREEEKAKPDIERIKRITDLEKDALDAFFSFFNHNLIGHRYFKERLRHSIKNFVALNKVKEQKVLSVFLYGASGIGKTEVARLLASGLHEDCYLAKINFQNYSSQDALNSLIGSPAGYIGCDHGELSDKIGKTKVGILLCDEFDKTTRPVFLFFLELLEEGRFTDSMAREYDLDGFIIVFTSNIRTKNEYEQRIPPELQTRFDLVCEFETPNLDEKKEFLELLLSKAKDRHKNQFDQFTMTEEDKKFLMGFDCTGLTALRDIKRVFNNRLMDLFESKGL